LNLPKTVNLQTHKLKNAQTVMNIPQFLKEVRHELAKVTWPTKNQIIQYTVVVIAISLAMAIFLGLLDFMFEWLLNRFII